MKANEAPEKLYIDLFKGEFNVSYSPTNNSVEYTRTDAFIEKACAWIKESVTNNPECNRIISKKGVITMGLLIKDLKKYIKGE